MCFGAGNSRRLGSRPCQDCSECTLSCGGDFYARKVNLYLPDGRTSYRTCAGSCISFLVVILTLALAILGTNEMMHDNSFVMQVA